jgi:hypothetical protein
MSLFDLDITIHFDFPPSFFFFTMFGRFYIIKKGVTEARKVLQKYTQRQRKNVVLKQGTCPIYP